jgi:acetyl esterase/lipase
MPLWDEDLEALRPQLRAESEHFVGGFPRPVLPEGASLEEQARIRRQAEDQLTFSSDLGVDRFVEGPAGRLRLREFRPDTVEGVMLHIHGGGWMTGSPEVCDLLNQGLSADLRLAVVSVDYRLAPEHPYPAGPEDCEAAADWLVEHAVEEYGTDRLLVGGESAGAHLAALTLLRLRDHSDAARVFLGANLVFGAYDLAGTPSARGMGRIPGPDLLDPADIALMAEAFAGGFEDRRRPEVSPLYAELSGMPPALFTVGTDDHLLDDTLFMASRWQAAGNDAELLVYPDTPHACIGLPTVFGHWYPRLEAFLSGCLARPAPAG